jgi:hypothetical protein
MSYRPHAFGFFWPTGCESIPLFPEYQAYSPSSRVSLPNAYSSGQSIRAARRLLLGKLRQALAERDGIVPGDAVNRTVLAVGFDQARVAAHHLFVLGLGDLESTEEVVTGDRDGVLALVSVGAGIAASRAHRELTLRNAHQLHSDTVDQFSARHDRLDRRAGRCGTGGITSCVGSTARSATRAGKQR